MTIAGDSTLRLIGEVMADGADHLVVLMRHSAREFGRAQHDLNNQLTDEGRDLAIRLGERLPKNLLLRGYTSPSERCVETAKLVLEGHDRHGGEITRSRPAEALGVFYILDQMKMFRAMQEAGGQRELLHRWYAGEVAADIMIPAGLTAGLISRFAALKLDETISTPQLDLLVSHDMTLYTLRDQLLKQPAGSYGEIDFLDGMALYRRGDACYLRGDQGEEVELALDEPDEAR